MQIPTERAMNGIAAFAELDALPHMPNSIKKVGAYMAIEAAKRNPSVLTKPYEQFFKMLGVVSEDGSTVDVDALSNYMRSAFEKVPSVNLWGFTFDSKDVSKLLARIGGQ